MIKRVFILPEKPKQSAQMNEPKFQRKDGAFFEVRFYERFVHAENGKSYCQVKEKFFLKTLLFF